MIYATRLPVKISNGVRSFLTELFYSLSIYLYKLFSLFPLKMFRVNGWQKKKIRRMSDEKINLNNLVLGSSSMNAKIKGFLLLIITVLLGVFILSYVLSSDERLSS